MATYIPVSVCCEDITLNLLVTDLLSQENIFLIEETGGAVLSGLEHLQLTVDASKLAGVGTKGYQGNNAIFLSSAKLFGC